MATVLAQHDMAPVAPRKSGEVVPFPTETSAAPDAEADALVREAQAGIQRLIAMTPNQLRQLIAERVAMLETELKEREARRAALEEARAAQRVLELRRRRAQRIQRRVNIASSLLMAMFACFIVISVL